MADCDGPTIEGAARNKDAVSAVASDSRNCDLNLSDAVNKKRGDRGHKKCPGGLKKPSIERRKRHEGGNSLGESTDRIKAP